MKAYVGVTDNNWFGYLSQIVGVDEVNFWQPSADHPFKALSRVSSFSSNSIARRTTSSEAACSPIGPGCR
jgi:hypothetical protein